MAYVRVKTKPWREPEDPASKLKIEVCSVVSVIFDFFFVNLNCNDGEVCNMHEIANII
jgi:uncharacterized membrane protein YGL010W